VSSVLMDQNMSIIIIIGVIKDRSDTNLSDQTVDTSWIIIVVTRSV